MKTTDLTKEDVKTIIELESKGVYQNDIAEEFNVSGAHVSLLTRAYRGDLKCYNKLGKTSQDIIDKLVDENKLKIDFPEYEARILFGLFKLTLKPRL